MTRGENRTVTSKLRVDTSHWDHVHLHRHAGVNFKMSQRVTEAPNGPENVRHSLACGAPFYGGPCSPKHVANFPTSRLAGSTAVNMSANSTTV